MNSKSFIGIISLVIVLLFVWGGMKYFGNSDRITDLESLGIGPISEEYVDTIIIERADERLDITRRGGEWKIGEYGVAPTQLALIWEALADVSVSGPVSRNSSNFERFGVGDTDMSVVFRKGDHEQRLRIGTQATTFDTTYIRNAERNEVYVAAANLRSLFSTQLSDWRDKTILEVNPEEVHAVEVTRSGETIRLERDDIGAWVVVQTDTTQLADTSAVESLFANLNPLTARAFVDESGAFEFDRRSVDVSIALYDAEGELNKELHLAEEGDYWWARVVGEETVFDIQRYKLADVLVSEDTLLGIVAEEEMVEEAEIEE